MPPVAPPQKTPPPPPPRPLAPVAAVLSYLVPGLGQIYQGRVGKGLLFLVCLYGLFFYGMYLGSWQNVYIPPVAQTHPPWENNTTWQLRNKLLADLSNRLQFVGQFWIGVAAWPAVYQYANFKPHSDTGPLFGTFQRMPDETNVTNNLIRDGDKSWDLGWIYTVIAGVLNVLVIYDALAGPAFAGREAAESAAKEAAAA